MKSLTLSLVMIALLAPSLFAQQEIAIGKKAPDFSVTTLGNQEFKLSDHLGKPVVLIFSRAHW